MDTRELKKMLAGLGVAGLIAGAGLGSAQAADKAGGSG
ncbi:MAG: SbtA family thio(seleno)oxazole RiPP natural product precursor [Thermodesulfobacteriota bacterium]